MNKKIFFFLSSLIVTSHLFAQSISAQETSNEQIAATVVYNIEASSLDLSSVDTASATLTTDKGDYFPTDSALITGTDFKTNYTYALTIGSTDEPATETTVSILTDENGTFAYAYQLDGIARLLYTVTLRDGDTIVLSITFTDPAPKVQGSYNLDQGKNGGTGDPVISPVDWINGNLNQSSAHYIEGQSVPYRVILSDLPTGVPSSIKIEWDIRQSGKNAIDYITGPQRISETVDPAIGVTGAGLPTPYSIPTPNALIRANSFNALTNDDNNKSLWAYNVSSLNFGSYVDGSDTDANSSTSVVITFTPTSPTVVLAWGGHIAAESDWGAGNGATALPGSPYHTRVLELCNGEPSACGGGNQDRSLAASAVIVPQTGHIIVDKVTDPAGDLQSFSFDAFGGTYIDFNLTDQDIPNDQELPAGTYNISEAVPAGWTQSSATCSDGSPVNAIDLAVGETITCTFTNTKKSHIIIIKDAINNDAQNFTFHNNFGNGNPDTFLLDDDSNATLLNTQDFEVLPGTYFITEDAVTGWQQESASCDGGETIDSIDVAPGETVTCTFVNEEFASIILVKNTVGGEGDFTFNMTGDGLPPSTQLTTVLGTASQTFNDLDQDNTFSISEVVPTGWELTGSSCTGTNTPSSITPNPDETVTCTFTNEKLPTLTLVKTVNNDNGGTATETDFQGSIDSANVNWDEATILGVGVHSASETILPGYEPSDWGGDCAADGSISLTYGDNKTCTITNDDIAPKLTVIKHVTNDNSGTLGVSDFPLFVNATSVVNGQSNDFNAGSYTVSESEIEGYEASDWSGDCAPNGSITLQVGDSKTCEITNDDISPTLTIVKNANPNDAQDFHFTSDTLGAFDLDDDAGVVDPPGIDQAVSKTFTDITAGEHIITETEPNQYWVLHDVTCVDSERAEFPVVVTGTSASINLALAENITCTFTNQKLGPTRTQGFWQTHTNYTTTIFNTYGITIGNNSDHKGPIDSIGKLLGAYYSNIAKKTNKTKRLAVDQTRMILLGQLVTAKLNCTAFGCPISIQTLITLADAAYAAGNAPSMLNYSGQLDTYNNSGDTIIIFPNPGRATPQLSVSLANLIYWDNP